MNRTLTSILLTTVMVLAAGAAGAQRTGSMKLLGENVKLKKTINFMLPVDYDYSNMRMVKTAESQAAGTIYTVGRIRHHQFVVEGKQSGLQLDCGKNISPMQFYATNDDRVIAEPQKGMPRELALFVSRGKTYLASNVVREARTARKDTVSVMSFKTSKSMALSNLFNQKQGHFELEIDITPDTARVSGFDLLAEKGDTCRIYLDNKAGRLALADRSGELCSAPLSLCEGEKYHLDIFVDQQHVDIFVDEGRIAMGSDIVIAPSVSTLRLFSKGGKSKFSSIYIYGL